MTRPGEGPAPGPVPTEVSADGFAPLPDLATRTVDETRGFAPFPGSCEGAVWHRDLMAPPNGQLSP